jgi:hypothetical protein
MSINDLDVIGLFASGPIRNVLRTSFVMFGSLAFFELDMKLFVTHPANTLAFQGIRALEETAVVHLAELLIDEHNVHPVARTIRGRDLLKIHRDIISHPWTVKWRGRDRQQFADDKGKRWSPYRAGLVWDVLKDINEKLSAGGREVRIPELPVDYEMALQINFILTRSVRPEVKVHPTEAILGWLQAQRPKFVRKLEKHPDGVPEEESDHFDVEFRSTDDAEIDALLILLEDQTHTLEEAQRLCKKFRVRARLMRGRDVHGWVDPDGAFAEGGTEHDPPAIR